jgi:hypothetical protein
MGQDMALMTKAMSAMVKAIAARSKDMAGNGAITAAPYRGKKVYFAARWENTRGEKRPWNDVVAAIT